MGVERLGGMVTEGDNLGRSSIIARIGGKGVGGAGRPDALARNPLALVDYGSGIPAILFNQSELFNRQATMVAAYNMALERISTDNPKMPMAERQNLSSNEALYDTQEYNDGSTLETSPRFTQENIVRGASIYRTYALHID